MNLCGIKLQMSTSRHPQTNGSSEIMNSMLENYLRGFCNCRQDNWPELLPGAEVAYKSALRENLGVSPFQMDLGWKPKEPLDMFSHINTKLDSLDEFVEMLKVSLKDAKYAYKVARARQSAASSMKYEEPSYEVGDNVWLKEWFMDSYSKEQPSDKLKARRYDPFEIISKVVKNALKLNLPNNIKIHPVVHVSNTTPQHDQPADIGRQLEEAPSPVPTKYGDEFVVEAILGHRKRGRGYQFLTLMRGVPEYDAEQQPGRDFIDLDGIMNGALADYMKKYNITL